MMHGQKNIKNLLKTFNTLLWKSSNQSINQSINHQSEFLRRNKYLYLQLIPCCTHQIASHCRIFNKNLSNY